uniref:TM2 domain-containing protein n=1 Tax=Esox lucius TaxID=8010 RepID=A0A3P8XTQ9_ESOLU
MVKKVTVTYALWALGGPLGLHHLYLGRDNHALLWMLTLGGFGVGWAREFFRIPAYVGEANREMAGAVRERTTRQMPRPPPVSAARFAGQISVGIYFGTVALIGLNSLSFFYLIVLPLSVGAGVHLVSSVGDQTTDLHKTLLACIITSPIFYGSTISPLPISIAASVTAAQHRRFKTHPPSGSQKELGPRVYRLTLAWLAFSAPLAYCVFHNTTATLYYLSDCVAALLDMFWFFPWLRSVVEYFLLLPYRYITSTTTACKAKKQTNNAGFVIVNVFGCEPNNDSVSNINRTGSCAPLRAGAPQRRAGGKCWIYCLQSAVRGRERPWLCCQCTRSLLQRKLHIATESW